jgi:SAM-dependent methyltransferase
MNERIKALIPSSIRPFARGLYHSATDRLELLTGKRDPLTPPRRMWHLITSPELDFKAEGEGLRRFLQEECGLKPDEAVLDVGCGIGRNAVPLIGHVRTYDGFDIMPETILWCRKNITPRHPNFRFHLADVHSDRYNPGGMYPASEYSFPFEDERFDLVFLVSVFTHMLPVDMERYLSEIARVLRPGGRVMISYFLLNDASRENIAAGQAAFDFKFDVGGCYAQLEELPEAAIAYEEGRVRSLYEKYGLSIREPIQFGKWSSSPAQNQDIVVASKAAKQ